MKLEEFLIEKQINDIKVNDKLDESLFSIFKRKSSKEIDDITKRVMPFAKTILSSELYNKLEDNEKNISYKEVKKNKKVIGYSLKNTIYLNKNVFFGLSKTKQIEYILHEMLHKLQKKDSSLREKGKVVYSFYKLHKKDKSTSESEISMGIKNLSKKYFNEDEVLPYLLNEKVDFSLMEDGSKEKFISLLKSLNLFKIDSVYWKNKFNINSKEK